MHCGALFPALPLRPSGALSPQGPATSWPHSIHKGSGSSGSAWGLGGKLQLFTDEWQGSRRWGFNTQLSPQALGEPVDSELAGSELEDWDLEVSQGLGALEVRGCSRIY